MTALVKFLITLILSVFLISCNFNPGVKGNGNVQTQQRLENETFSSIKASDGLNVYITQSTNNNVKVQADENLHELIKTEVKENALHIYTTENLGKAEAKKVIVNFTDISTLKTSSGSSLIATNAITTSQLAVKASSGSSIELTANTQSLTCKASSGANIELNGETNTIEVKASSGSLVNAKNMLANNCETDASSGSSIKLNCTKSINAESSSGSSIRYTGNPTSVNENKSSAGSISAN